MRTEVTTYYLEMTDLAHLRPKPAPRPDLQVMHAQIPLPELNRFLYTAVGGNWFWTMRLGWTHAQWSRRLESPNVQTWVFYVAGTPAGYAELVRTTDGSVEISSFGLISRFVGLGLGGYWLTEALRAAWAFDASRVWLHTCTLDHPQALANYQARGLTLYKEETAIVDLPDQTPGPWPGAMD